MLGDPSADVATNMVVESCNLLSIAIGNSEWSGRVASTAPLSRRLDVMDGIHEKCEGEKPVVSSHPRYYRVIQNKPEVFKIVTDCLPEVRTLANVDIS